MHAANFHQAGDCEKTAAFFAHIFADEVSERHENLAHVFFREASGVSKDAEDFAFRAGGSRRLNLA